MRHVDVRMNKTKLIKTFDVHVVEFYTVISYWFRFFLFDINVAYLKTWGNFLIQILPENSYSLGFLLWASTWRTWISGEFNLDWHKVLSTVLSFQKIFILPSKIALFSLSKKILLFFIFQSKKKGGGLLWGGLLRRQLRYVFYTFTLFSIWNSF